MKSISVAALCLTMVVAAAMAQNKFPDTCSNGNTPQFPNPTAATIDKKCGLAGTPNTPADGLQNNSKNDFCAEGSSPTSITLDKITSLQGDAEAKEAALHFTPGKPPKSRDFLKTLGEGNLVVFEGYVFAARQECKETVNCGLTVANVDASHDIHIALLADPRKTPNNKPKTKQDKAAQDGEECTGFVGEMIPHHRPAEWTACNVNDVATQGLRVRVTGHQLFDGAHVPCKDGAPVGSNPKRVSLWEIHPIYKFEVCPQGDCANGGWKSLEEFAAGKTKCAPKKCTVKPSSGTKTGKTGKKT